MNTVSCISRISFIDGDKGILEYRGFPINQLAEKAKMIEVSFLLVYGELPSKQQLKNFDTRLRQNYQPNPKLKTFMEAYVKLSTPANQVQGEQL